MYPVGFVPSRLDDGYPDLGSESYIIPLGMLPVIPLTSVILPGPSKVIHFVSPLSSGSPFSHIRTCPSVQTPFGCTYLVVRLFVSPQMYPGAVHFLVCSVLGLLTHDSCIHFAILVRFCLGPTLGIAI